MQHTLRWTCCRLFGLRRQLSAFCSLEGKATLTRFPPLKLSTFPHTLSKQAQCDSFYLNYRNCAPWGEFFCLSYRHKDFAFFVTVRFESFIAAVKQYLFTAIPIEVGNSGKFPAIAGQFTAQGSDFRFTGIFP